jgi:predicted ABC-type ATPase
MVIIGGPNGAGKTTIARRVVLEAVGIVEYVNADVIAAGLAGFAPERAAMSAGRIMLKRLDELAEQRADFAFETTLASRTFAPWAKERVREGYQVHMIYVWLESPELAISRVAQRVRKGGHEVPKDIVRRRYTRSIWNFVHLYMPIVETAGYWRLYDNSRSMSVSSEVLVAHGGVGRTPTILIPDRYNRLLEQAHEKDLG